MKLLHLYLLISETVEYCFNIQLTEEQNSDEDSKLFELLTDGFDTETIHDKPQLDLSNNKGLEIGPLMNFDTQFSSQTVSICKNIGLNKIIRIERSIRYLGDLDLIIKNHCISTIQTVYDEPLKTFESGKKIEPVRIIQLIEQGISAFDDIEELSFNDNDKEFYYDLFVNKWKRNPTDVELFDLLIYNCEQSRVCLFNSKIVIDGKELINTTFEKIIEEYKSNPEIISQMFQYAIPEPIFSIEMDPISKKKQEAKELADECGKLIAYYTYVTKKKLSKKGG